MKISEQVSNILAVSRASRNSDKELQLIYLQKSGMGLTPNQVELFKKLPSMETIRRTRQQLQMEGKYPADEEVNEKRYKKYQEMKQGAGLVEPDTILEAPKAVSWLND